MDNKSRMTGDCQVRFRERLKLKCFCLLDFHPNSKRIHLRKTKRDSLVSIHTFLPISQNHGNLSLQTTMKSKLNLIFAK